jgi:hypothetical protein
LIGFNLFAMGSLQQCSLLPDHLLHPSGTGSHRYGIRLCPSHLLSEFHCLGRILSQALQPKKQQQQKGGGVKSMKEGAERCQEGKIFSFPPSH